MRVVSDLSFVVSLSCRPSCPVFRADAGCEHEKDGLCGVVEAMTARRLREEVRARGFGDFDARLVAEDSADARLFPGLLEICGSLGVRAAVVAPLEVFADAEFVAAVKEGGAAGAHIVLCPPGGEAGISRADEKKWLESVGSAARNLSDSGISFSFAWHMNLKNFESTPRFATKRFAKASGGAAVNLVLRYWVGCGSPPPAATALSGIRVFAGKFRAGVAAGVDALLDSGAALSLTPFSGIPLCFTSDPARAMPLFSHCFGAQTAPPPEFARGSACPSCAMASRCHGLDAELAGVFGEALFKPLAASAALDEAASELVRRSEAGVGDSTDAAGVIVRNTTSASGTLMLGDADDRQVRESVCLVVLGSRCNQRCVFCSVHDRPDADRAAVEGTIRDYVVRGGRHIVFSGGEPTVYSELPDLIALAARIAGERADAPMEVAVSTNGVRLADRAYLDRLIAAGVTLIELSLHAHRPDLLAALTGDPGAAATAEAAIANLQAAGLKFSVNCVVTRPLLPLADEYIRFLAGLGYRGELNFAPLIPHPPFGPEEQALIVSHTEMLAAYDAAARTARDFGIMFTLRNCCGGIPPCILRGSPHADRLAPDDSRFTRGADRLFHTPRCSGCALRAGCFGVHANYLRLFGDSELKPAPTEE